MIKDEYKNIPDDEFVPLTCVDDNLLGAFEINKLGTVRNSRTLYVFSGAKDGDGYKLVTLLSNKFQRTYKVHRLVAMTFLKDPDDKNKKYVDHINRVRTDNSVYNLRWVTPRENTINNGGKKYSPNWFRLYDENWNLVKEVSSLEFSVEERDQIRSHSSLYKGYYWRQFNKELEDRLKKLGKTIDELEFVEFPRSPKILVSKEGILKIKKNNYTLGSSNGKGYKVIHTREGNNRQRFLVHRVVFETFSGVKLEDSDIIDHIDTVKDNNAFENLRLCKSQSENKMNPNTRAKAGRSVNQYSLDGTFLKTFPSLSIATEEVGGDITSLGRACLESRKSYKGFIWKYADLDPNTPEYYGKTPKKYERRKVTRRVNQYKQDGVTLIKTYSSASEASRETGVDKSNVGRCCTGKHCTAGGYIWRYADTDPNTPEYHKK